VSSSPLHSGLYGANLKAWWEAGHGWTAAGGGSPATWASRVGSHVLTAPSEATSPARVTGVLGGRDVIRADAVTKYMTCPHSTDFEFAGGGSIWVLYRMSTGGSGPGPGPIGKWSSTAADALWKVGVLGTGNAVLSMYDAGGTLRTTTLSSRANDGNYRLMGIHNNGSGTWSGSLRIGRQGTTLATGSGLHTEPATPLSIFRAAHDDVLQASMGDIALIVVLAGVSTGTGASAGNTAIEEWIRDNYFSIPTHSLRWQASRGALPASGGRVAAWTDTRSGVDATQGTDANRPTQAALVAGARPGLTGSVTCTMEASAASVPSLASGFSTWAVVRDISSTAGIGIVAQWDTSSAAESVFRLLMNQTGGATTGSLNVSEASTNTERVRTTSGDLTTAAVRLVIAWFDGSNIYAWDSNSNTTTAATACAGGKTSAVTGLRLFAASLTTGNNPCTILDIGLANVVYSSDERACLGGTLRHTYAF